MLQLHRASVARQHFGVACIDRWLANSQASGAAVSADRAYRCCAPLLLCMHVAIQIACRLERWLTSQQPGLCHIQHRFRLVQRPAIAHCGSQVLQDPIAKGQFPSLRYCRQVLSLSLLHGSHAGFAVDEAVPGAQATAKRQHRVSLKETKWRRTPPSAWPLITTVPRCGE